MNHFDQPVRPVARAALTSLALCSLLAALGTGSVVVALPAMARDFGASFGQVQWVIIAYLLAVTSLVLGVGRLGDRVGRRRLLVTGLAIFSIASVLCGAATSLPVMIAARAGQGVGAAMLITLSLALVGDCVPKARSGRAMGMLGTMSAAGTALGPSLGGLLVDSIGWRATFLANVPLGIVALLLAWRYLPQDQQRPVTGHVAADTIAALLLALTLAAFAFAMTAGRQLTLALLIVSGTGAGLYVLAERRSSAPLMPWTMLRKQQIALSLTASTVVSMVMMATLVVGPFYLSQALGLAPDLMGMTMAVGPVAAALMGWPAGRLADAIGAPRVVLIGMTGVTMAAGALAVVPAAWGVPGYLGSILVLTTSYALFQAANNSMVMAVAGTAQRGMVSGILNLSRNLGLITGASFMATLFARGAATAEVTNATPAALSNGMQLTFGVGAGLVALVLAFACRAHGFGRE